MENRFTLEAAQELLKKYVKSETLLRHCYSVAAAMRHFAKLYGEDAEKWEVIGLLHDVDYEMYPQEHCKKTREIMNGWPEEYIRAIESHGYKLVNDVEPKTNAEKVLYTVDELTGFITAVAILRPGKSVIGLPVKSVRKKWKQKKFAAGVNRDIINEGIAMLGREWDDVVEQTILGMSEKAQELGLAGEPA